MAEFAFDCLDIQPEPYAASPTLTARLRVAETTGFSVQAIALRCQIRIEPATRGYRDDERELLRYLFGEPARWGRTMRAFPFATVSALVGSFVGSTEVPLRIPVSYDLEVAAGKYFHALRTGVIPLSLLFSGTVFGATLDGMQVEPVPWHLEASYRLPVTVWQRLMDAYFPGEAWVRLRRETIDAVGRYKVAHAIPTWDDAISELLAGAEPDPTPAGAGDPSPARAEGRSRREVTS
ncbi:hypothetical protein I6A60_10405 [Frankia sp. AgB1.9]|uniref:DUF6084 family protein n=1 Tax=unclassified Frankia TaxID=2632575 RepID=UPI0019318E6D|nr:MULTISPECIES: DUF6084 family protein [unclassified Frankia]MBL7488058.1 hypothetical protein [Frankia sp. AgW1.1]MBL7548285.1 hypothetical protein [Frankia sp. AgB1.9]MBL7618868.1 hypothetical protein [Frankia sp. AgB1.8]